MPRNKKASAEEGHDTDVSERRIKKREIDRKFQRQARERTKTKIADLEALVLDLQNNASSALSKRLLQTEKERDNLMETIRRVREATDRISTPVISSESDPPLEKLSGVSATCHNFKNDRCKRCSHSESLWYWMNELIQHEESPDAGDSATSTEESSPSENVLAQIILRSWSFAYNQTPLRPEWKLLRQFDERLLKRVPATVRLALLWLIQMLLQHQQGSKPPGRSELPTWYLPRPAQSLPHAPAIDLLPFPGLRERLVFEQHKYCNDSFVKRFWLSLHIAWPLDVRQCFVQSPHSNTFGLSVAFKNTITNLANWSLDPSIVNQYPDVRNDLLLHIATSDVQQSSFQGMGGYSYISEFQPWASELTSQRDPSLQLILASQTSMNQVSDQQWMPQGFFHSSFHPCAVPHR
jgi:hypothetical protein